MVRRLAQRYAPGTHPLAQQYGPPRTRDLSRRTQRTHAQRLVTLNRLEKRVGAYLLRRRRFFFDPTRARSRVR